MSNLGEGNTEDDVIAIPTDFTDLSSTSPGLSEVEPSLLDMALPETEETLLSEEVEEEEPLPEFDPKYIQDFEGLTFIGSIQHSFKWMGHTFVIRTPKIDILLEAGQLHQPYVGTISDVKAWQALMVAATLVSVDGQPLPTPISDEQTGLETKFKYINLHWYPWTLDKLYEEYLLLDARVAKVISTMGKA